MHLSSLGYDVYLASRLVRDTPEVLKLGTPVHINWNDNQSLYDSCQNMDVIVHAAGMNSGDCLKNPDLAFEFNGSKTGNLVKQAKRAGVKKFIYLSTAHVYSSKLSGIINENTALTNSHVYPSSKVVGENSVTKINTESDMQGIIIRLSNAFGTPIHPGVNCWMLLLMTYVSKLLQTKK